MDAGGPRLLDEERLCQAAEYEAGRHCLTVTFRKYLKDLFVNFIAQYAQKYRNELK